jgi:hypothetical protein
MEAIVASGEKRIFQSFAADGGVVAVAGEDAGGVGKGNSFFDAGEKLLGRSAREVSAADAVEEQSTSPPKSRF